MSQYSKPSILREKSLAFAVELNSTGEEALTDAEADATMQALVEVLERAGARLRA